MPTNNGRPMEEMPVGLMMQMAHNTRAMDGFFSMDGARQQALLDYIRSSPTGEEAKSPGKPGKAFFYILGSSSCSTAASTSITPFATAANASMKRVTLASTSERLSAIKVTAFSSSSVTRSSVLCLR